MMSFYVGLRVRVRERDKASGLHDDFLVGFRVKGKGEVVGSLRGARVGHAVPGHPCEPSYLRGGGVWCAGPPLHFLTAVEVQQLRSPTWRAPCSSHFKAASTPSHPTTRAYLTARIKPLQCTPWITCRSSPQSSPMTSSTSSGTLRWRTESQRWVCML